MVMGEKGNMLYWGKTPGMPGEIQDLELPWLWGFKTVNPLKVNDFNELIFQGCLEDANGSKL
jgi:hypothetical protein